MSRQAALVKDAATQYARGVLSGKHSAGRLVRLACERHMRDLARAGTKAFPFAWDPGTGELLCEFAGMLTHYKGEFAGRPFTLEPFQKFVIFSVLGWRHVTTGLRRFRTAVFRVPRKNGKTALAAVLALWLMLMDREEGAEVYCLATTRPQAKLVYRDVIKYLDHADDDLRSAFRDFGNTEVPQSECSLTCPATSSVLRPLSAEAKTLDGLNPHAGIADEVHAWPDRELWNVIEDGMGARRQPLMIDISTAGNDPNSFAADQQRSCEDVLEETLTDETLFAFIACADKDDVERWDQPDVWAKANPGLGPIKRLDYMVAAAANVRRLPSGLNTFLIKQLNLWVAAAERWIDPQKWSACAHPDGRKLAELLLGQPCCGGLDLARVADLSAFALCFRPEHVEAATGIPNKWAILTWHWLPEVKLRVVSGEDEHGKDAKRRRHGDRVPYDVWHRQGWLTVTPGEVTDFERVRGDVLAICSRYQCPEIAFDRMFAPEAVRHLMDAGIIMTEFGQGFVSMATPSADFERRVIAGELLHDGSPVMRWETGNVIIATDAGGNIKPDKKQSREKIDGVVAAIMAVGLAGKPEMVAGIL